jgi:peroxiredoxin
MDRYSGEGNRTRARVRPSLLSSAAIAALMLVAVSTTSLIGCAEPETSVKIGEEAPDFSLKLYRGTEELSLRELRGKVVLLNIWASWCPPCRAELPALVSLQNDYKDRGFEIVGVIMQSKEAETDAIIAEFGIGYSNVEGDMALAKTWSVSGYPTTYIIDTGGIVRQRYEGARSRSTFERDIVRYLGPES